MSTIASTYLTNLMTARRLLEIAKNEELRRNGKDVEKKSALDYMQEDQALISVSAQDIHKQEVSSPPQIDNININLSDPHGIAKQNVVQKKMEMLAVLLLSAIRRLRSNWKSVIVRIRRWKGWLYTIRITPNQIAIYTNSQTAPLLPSSTNGQIKA